MQLLASVVVLLVSSFISAAPVAKRASNVLFAPYLDATTNYDPTPYFKSTGTKHFTLAFVTADGNGNPQWNGYFVSNKFYADKIATIRALGGDVSISFGGAAGKELALVAKDAASLAATYLNVLNTYNVSWADFDVEGGAISNLATVDLRNQAIAIMQAKQPNIKISYTLPVIHTGLVASGINVIQSAVNNKARVDVLNIMVMDYYENIPYVDSNGKSLMGQYAISATQGTYNQVGSKVGSIGICPMIGINDDPKEIFTLADATEVATWAASTSYVSWMSFWVVGADVAGNVDGKNAASGAYARAILAGLGGGQQVTTTTTTTTKIATTTTATVKPSTTTTTTTTTAAASPTVASGCYTPWSSATASYNGGAQVSYNNVNYVAKWWADKSNVPGAGDPWNPVGPCGGSIQTTTAAATTKTTTTTTTTTAAPTTVTTTTKNAATTTGSSSTVVNNGTCATFGAWECNYACICNYAASGLVWQCTGVSGC